MQTGGLSNTKNILSGPDFNNQKIVIAKNCMYSRFGIRKAENFSFMQRKTKIAGSCLKIQAGCFLKNRGFLTGTT